MRCCYFDNSANEMMTNDTFTQLDAILMCETSAKVVSIVPHFGSGTSPKPGIVVQLLKCDLVNGLISCSTDNLNNSDVGLDS